MKKYFFIFWYLLIVTLLIILGFFIFRLYNFGYSGLLIVLCCFYFSNLFFTVLLFFQKRKSIVKLSWIVVIGALPFLGYLFFVIFGQKYRGRISLKKYHQRNLFSYETLETNSLKKDLFQKQSIISKRGVYQANFELISLNIGSYEKIFKDLKKARRNIFIQFYIIKPGEIYEQFKKILIEKAKQNVKVKIIVDDFGRWALPWYEINELRKNGLEIGVFSPVRFPFVGSKNGYRMHRKMILIDNEMAYTGGLNIASEYANNNKKYGLWLDAQFKIKGPLVNSYLLLFANDWKEITFKEIPINKKMFLQNDQNYLSKGIMVEDSPKIKEFILERSLIKWIFNAKKDIKITTPYFVPTQGILDALKTASQMGVKITIYIPGKPDKKSVLIVSKFWAKELIPYGINFKVTHDILIHSKLAVFDNKYAYLGTANLDIRSLSSQFEFLNLVEGQVVKEINKEFLKYDKLSKNLELKKESKNFIIRSFKNFFVRLFAYVFSPLM